MSIAGASRRQEFFTQPPLIWIEILSRDDKPVRVTRIVREAVEFGAGYVWVIDPETLESYVTTKIQSMSCAMESSKSAIRS